MAIGGLALVASPCLTKGDKNMNQEELEQVISYQKKSLDYIYKWLREEVEREKLNERKCKFCGELAEKDAFDEDGKIIEICEKCDSKSLDADTLENNL